MLPEDEPQPATGTTLSHAPTVPKPEPPHEAAAPTQQQTCSDASTFSAWHSNPHFHCSPPASPRHANANASTAEDTCSPHLQPPAAAHTPAALQEAHYRDGQAAALPESAPQGPVLENDSTGDQASTVSRRACCRVDLFARHCSNRALSETWVAACLCSTHSIEQLVLTFACVLLLPNA